MQVPPQPDSLTLPRVYIPLPNMPSIYVMLRLNPAPQTPDFLRSILHAIRHDQMILPKKTCKNYNGLEEIECELEWEST